MKKLVALSLAIFMALALAACTTPTATPTQAPATEAPAATVAPATEAPAPAEKTQLKLGIWPEEANVAEVEQNEKWKAQFEAMYSDVEVIPSYYWYAVDTFVPLVESGNMPTIIQSWYTEPEKLIRNHYAADITDVLAKFGWQDAINPSIRSLLSDANGRIYGVPRDGYALGLMLNVELFEEAGLVDANGVPLYPATWEELAQTAKTIKEKTGAAGLCLLAKDNAGGWHFTNIAWAFGAKFEEQTADGKWVAHIDSPEAIAAMTFVKSLKWEYDVLTADPLNEDWGTGFAQLGTGAAAMYIGANDAVAQPTEINGLPVDKLSLMGLPAGPGGRFSLSGGTPYVFAPDSTPAQIEAALNWLILIGRAPEATEDAINGMKADAEYRKNAGIPVIPGFPSWIDPDYLAAQDAVVKEYSNVNMDLYNNYYDAIKSAGNLRLEEPVATQELYAALTKVLQTVLTDKNADVAALMATAQAEFQAVLDEQINK